MTTPNQAKPLTSSQSSNQRSSNQPQALTSPQGSNQPQPLTPLDTIGRLSVKLEDSFLTLGQLLSEIKKAKLYKLKGYETLKAYLETEHRFPSTLAAKLISIYDLFVGEMDLDEIDIVSIGFERLNLIRPLIKGADWEARESLLQDATNMDISTLREELKARKTAIQDLESPDLKTLFTQQFLERFTTALNCSRKELDFKLALFFQEADPEAIKKVVILNQRAFESQLTSEALTSSQSSNQAQPLTSPQGSNQPQEATHATR